MGGHCDSLPQAPKNLAMPLSTQTDFLSFSSHKYTISILQITHLIYDGVNGKQIKYMYNNDEIRLHVM